VTNTAAYGGTVLITAVKKVYELEWSRAFKKVLNYSWKLSFAYRLI
jgi:hypothetical protein